MTLPLEKHFPPECVLDHTRRAFLHEEALTLASLMSGGLERRNRFRRLLLGSKAVGKTMLLQSLLTAAEAAYPSDLLTLYVSYAAGKPPVRLAEMICSLLRDYNIIPSLADFLFRARVSEKTCRILKEQDCDVFTILLASESVFREIGISLGDAQRPPAFHLHQRPSEEREQAALCC